MWKHSWKLLFFDTGPPNPLDDRLDHRNGLPNPPSNTNQNTNPGGGAATANNNNNGNSNGNINNNNIGVLGDLSLTQHMTPAAALYARSNGSASSTSPPTVSTPSMLVVPQPINAAKMPPTPPGLLHNQVNGGGGGGGGVRKYQCKMCPQVRGRDWLQNVLFLLVIFVLRSITAAIL